MIFFGKGRSILLIFLFSIFFFAFSSAVSINQNNVQGVVIETPVTTSSFNNNTANVNNSNYLQGYQWSNAPYPDALYSTYNATYNTWAYNQTQWVGTATTNLNMMGKNITNVSNINATGTGTFGELSVKEAGSSAALDVNFGASAFFGENLPIVSYTTASGLPYGFLEGALIVRGNTAQPNPLMYFFSQAEDHSAFFGDNSNGIFGIGSDLGDDLYVFADGSDPTKKFYINRETDLGANNITTTGTGKFGTVSTNSIKASTGQNITFYNSTGSGYANLNAHSFNVFSPSDKSYTGNKLTTIPLPLSMLGTDGKLNRDYMFAGEKLDNIAIDDLSRPIIEQQTKKVCKGLNNLNCKNVLVNVTIGYEKNIENATSLGTLEFNNRLLISELKLENTNLKLNIINLQSENTAIKDCAKNSIDYKAYKECLS